MVPPLVALHELLEKFECPNAASDIGAGKRRGRSRDQGGLTAFHAKRKAVEEGAALQVSYSDVGQEQEERFLI